MLRVLTSAACGLSLLLAGSAVVAQPPGLDAGSSPLPYLLRLRPDQRAAWRAYNDELAQESADNVRTWQDIDQYNAMSTPQRLDWEAAQGPRRQADAERRANAVRAFYAALSPEQRRIFDDVTRMPVASPPPPPRSGENGRNAAPRGASLPQPPAGYPLPAPAGAGAGG